MLRCPALPSSSLAAFFQKGNGAKQANLLLLLFGASLILAYLQGGPLALLLLLLQTFFFLLPLQNAVRQLGGISGDQSLSRMALAAVTPAAPEPNTTYFVFISFMAVSLQRLRFAYPRGWLGQFGVGQEGERKRPTLGLINLPKAQTLCGACCHTGRWEALFPQR